MELKDYTEEQLKAELKRRVELRKAQKAEEMKTANRCRNCKHCQEFGQSWYNYYQCMVRTYGKKRVFHYSVRLSQKACDKFEWKEDVEPNKD